MVYLLAMTLVSALYPFGSSSAANLQVNRFTRVSVPVPVYGPSSKRCGSLYMCGTWKERNDAHELLGVMPGASAAALKAAFRMRALENHPDLNQKDPEAAQRKFLAIRQAYELLDNTQRTRSAFGVGPYRNRRSRRNSPAQDVPQQPWQQTAPPATPPPATHVQRPTSQNVQQPPATPASQSSSQGWTWKPSSPPAPQSPQRFWDLKPPAVPAPQPPPSRGWSYQPPSRPASQPSGFRRQGVQPIPAPAASAAQPSQIWPTARVVQSYAAPPAAPSSRRVSASFNMPGSQWFAELMPKEPKLLRKNVTAPSGWWGGGGQSTRTMMTSSPSGRVYQVVVPPTVRAGEVFEVEFPEEATPSLPWAFKKMLKGVMGLTSKPQLRPGNIPQRWSATWQPAKKPDFSLWKAYQASRKADGGRR